MTAPFLIQVCVYILVLHLPLTMMFSRPNPLCPSVTGSHPSTELCTVSWGLERTEIKQHHLSFPPTLGKLEAWLLHLFFLGPTGPLGRVGGWQDGQGQSEARGWVHQAGFFSFSQQTPGSDYLPSSLASCPSWSWSPEPCSGLKPEEQVTRGLE